MTTTTVADGNDTRRISSRRAAGSTRRKPSTGGRKWLCRTGQSRRASAVFRYAVVSLRALVSSRYRRLLYGVGLLELCRMWICLVRSAPRTLSCGLMTSRSANTATTRLYFLSRALPPRVEMTCTTRARCTLTLEAKLSTFPSPSPSLRHSSSRRCRQCSAQSRGWEHCKLAGPAAHLRVARCCAVTAFGNGIAVRRVQYVLTCKL